MQYDPIADALSRIRNAERSGHSTCEVRPASKLLGSVLKVMQEAGYIGPYEFVDDKRSGSFRVSLLGNVNNCGIIKPRYNVSLRDFERWEARYLPAQDFGSLILTTTSGVVSHLQAKRLGIGGRLLAYVY
jgi:small subunit ribosomal protein S8